MQEEIGLYYYNRGLACARQNHMAEGVENLVKSLQFKGLSSDSYNILGLCQYTLGRFDEACTVWEKSMDADSSQGNHAHKYMEYIKGEEFLSVCDTYNRALELAQSSNYKKAVETLEKGEALNAKCVLFNNFYGLCLYASGNKNKAVKAWKESLEIDNGNPDALDYLSNACDPKISGLPGWLRRIAGLKE